VVKGAIGALDAGDASAAAALLEDYLSTGACADGNIGAPDSLKRRADGTFDLGLALFRIGEAFGRRFGEEEEGTAGGAPGQGQAPGQGVDEATRAKRHAQVECARRIVQAIAVDETRPIELRARARYLEGNLDFLDGAYELAVRAYDEALVLIPGQVDGGDPVGRDAAHNRAIALRRLDDEKHKDAGADSSPPDASPPDASPDANDSGSNDAGQDSGGEAGSDGGINDDGGKDAGQDGSSPQSQDREDAGPPPSKDAGAEPPQPPPSANQDDRMLDMLENAPTLQQEEAKRMGKRRVRGMADK
jgi:hypothetical protein